jgi:hypothetical protein
MACFICLDGPNALAVPVAPTSSVSSAVDGLDGLVGLGCACRSDNGLAHVECMARFARATGRRRWRVCPTCMSPITGTMLHLLNGHSSGVGDAVCRIQEIARELAIATPPLNDQTCFRVPMPLGSEHRALSVAARRDECGLYYETVLLDESDRVVYSSAERFGVDEAPRLVGRVRSVCLLL